MIRQTHFVLIVEDDEIIRWVLAEHLVEAGFCVLQAADVDEAQEALSNSTEVELVVTDINMPGPRDGVDLAHWVHKTRPQVAVIVVSGRVDHMSAGTPCQRFVQKPYSLEGIEQEIRALLS